MTGNGVPDIALLSNGKTIWIETKITDSLSTTKIRPEQFAWHNKALRCNVIVFTITLHRRNDKISIATHPKETTIRDFVHFIDRKDFSAELLSEPTP